MATNNPPLGRVTSAPELHHPPLLDIPGPTIHRVKTDVVSGTQHVEVSHLDLLEHPVSWFRGVWRAFLATALFRCWHHILFFSAEAAVITYFADKDPTFKIDPAMVTVVGTFIGFIISLRTSASFDRYHEGRKYWSQLAHNALQFSRVVWFHVPQNKVVDNQTEAEARARTLIEKRTIINLIEGFAVAVKHHLRGENGVYYEDLYHLVKMLPAYAMESGVLSPMYSHGGGFGEKPSFQAFPHPDDTPAHDREMTRVGTAHTMKTGELPLPATATHLGSDLKQRKKGASAISLGLKEVVPTEGDAAHLLPARNPPATTIFDFWPFSMFVRYLTNRGRRVSGKKAGKLRAQSMRYGSKTQNVPLEISFYVSSYIRKQQQNTLDGLILAQLLDHSKLMVDAYVGLDRIQTTPIPFSYGVHLWTITVLYLLLLPFQLAQSLKWLTPAASALAAFAYCGLLRAGDEIEHPFGYDYNDLNLDHFTKHVIRKELRALTAMPIKDPSDWMFSGDNDNVFDDPSNARLHPTEKTKRKYPSLYDHTAELRRTPATWVQAGETQIMRALALTGGVDADAGMFKAAKEVPGLVSPVPRSPPSPSPSPSPTPGLQQAPTTLSVVSPSRQSSDRRVVHDFA